MASPGIGQWVRMIKKLPGLIWLVFLVTMAERRLAPGTFTRLLAQALGRPTAVVENAN